MRTPAAIRALAAAEAMLARHARGEPVHRLALEWARWMVEVNR